MKPIAISHATRMQYFSLPAPALGNLSPFAVSVVRAKVRCLHPSIVPLLRSWNGWGQ